MNVSKSWFFQKGFQKDLQRICKGFANIISKQIVQIRSYPSARHAACHVALACVVEFQKIMCKGRALDQLVERRSSQHHQCVAAQTLFLRSTTTKTTICLSPQFPCQRWQQFGASDFLTPNHDHEEVFALF